MKIGIIIDSSAGITKAEATKMGFEFLPLYLTINGKDYADGIDIDANKYYKNIKIDDDVRTSATPPGIIMDTLEKASKKYDHVIVYPLSKELSSQFNNISMMAKEHKNVTVIDSKGVGYMIIENLQHAKEEIEKGDVKAAVEKINNLSSSQLGVVIPETMDWLVKGGRASSSAASMANLLKIVPLILFKDGKLDKYGKGRVFKKAVIKTADQVKDEFKGDREWIIYNAGNKDIKEHHKNIEEALGTKVKVYPMPPIIGNHTGPGAIGIVSALKK